MSYSRSRDLFRGSPTDRAGWAIETVGLLFDFAQIAVVHQLIGTFGSDDPDNAYAYLCCIALFVCQVMSTALSALVR